MITDDRAPLSSALRRFSELGAVWWLDRSSLYVICILQFRVRHAKLYIDLYYMSFPKDRTLIKTVVYVTYIIEVLQTALATREAFRILGTGWGNPEVLLVVGWLGVSINILVSICKVHDTIIQISF